MGVRSSWDTFATNSLRRDSVRDRLSAMALNAWVSVPISSCSS